MSRSLHPRFLPETPLPYVSGAIIDGCGYLAGVSLSSGAQSLETTKAPRTLFTDALKPIFEQLQIELPSSSCVISTPLESTPPVVTEPEPKVVEPIATQTDGTGDHRTGTH